MKITYDLKTTELNHHFIHGLKAIYGDQKLEIIVDEKPATPEQKYAITSSDNPWIKYAGTFKDDPQYDEVLVYIEKYHQELDEEYYRELDAEHTKTL